MQQQQYAQDNRKWHSAAHFFLIFPAEACLLPGMCQEACLYGARKNYSIMLSQSQHCSPPCFIINSNT